MELNSNSLGLSDITQNVLNWIVKRMCLAYWSQRKSSIHFAHPLKMEAVDEDKLTLDWNGPDSEPVQTEETEWGTHKPTAVVFQLLWRHAHRVEWALGVSVSSQKVQCRPLIRYSYIQEVNKNFIIIHV